ncbi:MAG: hypothetical protein PHS56_07520 [Eubacteriales bacterium]|nr:hypothetical protein [Eubacteriales bacterium]
MIPNCKKWNRNESVKIVNYHDVKLAHGAIMNHLQKPWSIISVALRASLV